MCTEIVFSMTYIFSPSIDVDLTWDLVNIALRTICRYTTVINNQSTFHHYGAEALENNINVQHKLRRDYKSTT